MTPQTPADALRDAIRADADARITLLDQLIESHTALLAAHTTHTALLAKARKLGLPPKALRTFAPPTPSKRTRTAPTPAAPAATLADSPEHPHQHDI